MAPNYTQVGPMLSVCDTVGKWQLLQVWNESG